jgi:signal transduction histidine kinase
MKRLFDYGKRYAVDVLIVVVALGAAAELIWGEGEADTPKPDSPLWVSIPVIVLLILPLLARRWFPFAAPAGIYLGAAAISFVETALVIFTFGFFLAAIACAFLFGMLEDTRQRWIGLAIAVAAVAILVRNDPAGTIDDFIFVSLFFVIAWLAGLALGRKLREVDEARERAARLEREREERAREAVTDERARIARELHDVVGHAVSVMTVQAAGVRRLLRPDQEREREALTIVEQTGREALAEMRRLVGVLRRPEEAPALAPQPSLQHLERLVAQAREAGLPVDLRVEGDPTELAPGVDLTAYRLVQEGLTNAVKHARASKAEVLVRYGDGQVEIEVTDDGRGGAEADGGGHGLVGMRERVAVYGGELDAGPRPEGGYGLRARLPLR